LHFNKNNASISHIKTQYH